MSRNNIQHNAKIKVLITVIIVLLFANSRLVLCQVFSYDFPETRNLPKKFRECGPRYRTLMLELFDDVQ